MASAYDAISSGSRAYCPAMDLLTRLGLSIIAPTPALTLTL